MTETENTFAAAHRPALLVSLFTLCFVIVALFMRESSLLDHWQKAEFWLTLPVAQVLGMACILRFAGRPRTRMEIFVFVVTNGAMIGFTLLMSRDRHFWIVLLTLSILLRLGVAAAWLLSAAGIVLLAETIRRGRLRWRPWVPGALRLCLAVILSTMVLEGTAFLLAHSIAPKPALPDLPRKPDAQTLVVAAIGGSTMLGFPYQPKYGIAEVAVWQLRQTYPDRQIELVNLAQTGVNLALAMKELHRLPACPDVLFVYAGHNEFFHQRHELGVARKTSMGRLDEIMSRSPTFRIVHRLVSQYSVVYEAPESEQTLCSTKLCPDFVWRARLNRYVGQLELLFTWARRHSIQVVFCSPAADEADFAPNQSMCLSVSPEGWRVIQDGRADVRRLQQKGDTDEALGKCLELLKTFPDVAELHFRAGQCLRAAGRTQEALLHLEAALNLDQFPIRATGGYRQAGLQAASAHGVAVLDSAGYLRQHADDGLLGQNFFLDGVHPNLKATFLLGRRVAEIVLRGNLLNVEDVRPSVPESRLSFAQSVTDSGFNVRDLSRAYQTTSEVLRHYAEFSAFDAKRRLSESERFSRMATQLAEGSLKPGEGGTESLTQVVPTSSSTAWPRSKKAVTKVFR